MNEIHQHIYHIYITKFRNRYFNCFNTSICFIRRLHFQKTQNYYFSTITELFNKLRFFSSYRFCTSSPSSRTLSTIKDFSFIEDVFLKQRYSVHQGHFQQVKAFPSSRKLSTSKDFSFFKEVSHKQRIFLYGGSFISQVKIFPSSRKFSSNKDNPFTKEGFHKPRLFP